MLFISFGKMDEDEDLLDSEDWLKIVQSKSQVL